MSSRRSRADSSTRVHQDVSAEQREVGELTPALQVTSASWCERAVGPKPQRSWREEWPALRVEELQKTGQFTGETAEWIAKHKPPEVFLKHSAASVKWKCQAGWSLEHAEAETAISSNGHAAVGAAVREESARYAACTHVACEALLAAAKRLGEPEPPCFRHLRGVMGLSLVDPTWLQLMAPDVAPGFSFVTSTIAFASDHSDSVTEQGYCVPLLDQEGKLSYRPQESDVVCFLSAAPDERGFRSLVQVSASGYHLPPMTTVTLEKVDGPGSWQAYGRRVRRRLYTVSVAYAG